MLQKAEETMDLIVPEKLDIERVFTPDGMDTLLKGIKSRVESFVPDATTDQGRKDIISLAFKVTKSKTFIVDTSDKDLTEMRKKIKDRKKVVDKAKTFLDDLRDKTRQPVTDWEAEQERIEEEKAEEQRKVTEERINALQKVGCVVPFIVLATMPDDEFQCLLDDKTFEFNEAEREKAEDVAAEKARLAKEAADRKAEDGRLAKQKEEQEAEAARQKAAQAELDAKQAKLDAQEKAIQDEKDRLTKEAADKKAAEDAEIQAAKDAEDLAKHQAKEKVEEEENAKAEAARQEALKPDKEKIDGWFGKIIDVIDDYPKVEDEEAAQLVGFAIDKMSVVMTMLLKEVQKL